MKTETVKLNYLHITPRKTRLVANLLKGLTVNEAEAQLLLRPQRVAKPLLKLLRSASSNAVHNKKMNVDQLIVDSIRVDQGPSSKRFLPRAMGRATPILKRTSHVTLVLKEVDKKIVPRFNITVHKPKKERGEKKKVKSKMQEEKIQPQKREKSGFLKKLFRRKSM